jgi:hypothetical protein
LASVLLLTISTTACDSFSPETGDDLTACVNGDSNPAVAIDFKKDIRPVMSGLVPGATGCKKCHYPDGATREGLDAVGLDLSSLGTLRKGGSHTSTNIVVPGDPCKSAIVQKLRGTFEGARMPKNGPYWSPEQIQPLMDWIAEGANGDDNE